MNVSKFLKNKTEDNIGSIRSVLYKNFIKTVIEDHSEVDNNFRIIFIGHRFKSDFNNPISFECNGLIIDYDRITKLFNLLVIPCELFNSQRLAKTEINRFYKENNYTLHKVYDGTIINLYFYKDQWRISTNKAYDATNLIFTDNKTYGDIFDELTQYYKEFSYDNLVQTKCYTICFKYSNYHLFIENKSSINNKLILIQSIDMYVYNKEGILNIKYNDNIGLPISGLINTEKDSINDIISDLNTEITRFKQQGHNENYVPNYGIILRSNNFSKTKNYSNIFIESNLMAKIRNFIYNHNFIKKLDFYDKLNTNSVVNKNYYNIINIINLKTFLKGSEINLYIALFPQYKELLNMYNEVLKLLTKHIIKHYNSLNKHIISISDIIKNNIKLDLELNTQLNINIDKFNKFSLIIVSELEKKISI